MSYCTNCGSELFKDAKFCHSCGQAAGKEDTGAAAGGVQGPPASTAVKPPEAATPGKRTRSHLILIISLVAVALVAAVAAVIVAVSKNDRGLQIRADVERSLAAYLSPGPGEQETLPALRQAVINRTAYELVSLFRDDAGYKAVIRLSAPSITGLLDRFEGLPPELAEEQIEEWLISMVESAPTLEQEFTLAVIETSAGMQPAYTEEFADAASGGLLTFYRELYQELIDELLETGGETE